jgi:cathepsin L
MVLYRAVFMLGCLVVYVSGAAVMEGESTPVNDTNFKAFMLQHGCTYEADSKEFEMRKAIFAKSTEEVRKHNRQTSNYHVGINKLSDRTPEELARLRGWKNIRRPNSASRGSAGSLHLVSTNVSVTELPREHSWTHLTTVKEVQDQGGCGSCWAFAAATVLRAHSEIWMKDPRRFSVQQIISCTQNPEECGGTGGCQGATAELAMDYVLKHGCQTEDELPYTAKDSECPASLLQEEPTEPGSYPASASLGMLGWTKLPENKVNPVKLALVTKGPVGVSISAGDAWNRYAGGVLDDCVQDAVIDHAVVLIGYGSRKSTSSLTSYDAFAEAPVEAGLKYWHLQNSWGTDWGEKGYLRMLRREDDFEESKQCGIDNDPQIGSGCKGGPSEVRVCGMCGLLYDTVIPHFADRRGTAAPAAAHLTQQSKHKTTSFLQKPLI